MNLSERCFRALMKNSMDIVAVITRAGLFSFVSESVSTVLGYDPGDLVGMALMDYVHPEDRPAVGERLAARMAAGPGSSGSMSFRLRHADGRWRHMEASCLNMLDDPEVKGIVGNIRDVTDQRESELRLRESEALYHTLAESAPVGIFRTNREGRIVFANGRFAELAGLPLDGVAGDGWLNGVHPEDRSRIAEEWERGTAEGEHLLAGFRFLGHEGTSTSVLCQSAPLHDTAGRWQGAIGTITDMSEYVRTAEALLRAEARTNAIVDAAADAILTIDQDGIVHSFNRAAEEMFGVSAADILWRRLDALIPPEFRGDHNLYLKGFEPGSTRPVVGHTRNLCALRGDGTRFPIELSVSAVEVEGRRLFTGIIRDITERKRIEADLIAAKEAADRAKSAFLAAMSHELRTPLNAIIGFAQVIEMRMFGPDAAVRYAEYASSIRQSGEHLLRIIDEILDISKIEAGGLTLNDTLVDVRDLVGQSLNLIALQAGQRGVAVRIDLEPDLPPLHADELRLRQILLNLLSNAVKFTDMGGDVTIRAARVADGFEFVVADTGVGMAPEDIPKALAPFSQVDQSISRRYEGTGLGLPLTKRLVELHGGTMTIDSALGRGTTVTVRLPASRVADDVDLG